MQKDSFDDENCLFYFLTKLSKIFKPLISVKDLGQRGLGRHDLLGHD